MGTWGLLGGVAWVEGEGDGGLAARKWANPDWPGVNNGGQPPRPNLQGSSLSCPGSGYPCWTLRHLRAGSAATAALSFLLDLRGGLPRHARAG